MKKGQMKKIEERFSNYVAAFYGDDKFINSNIKMKEDHSRRTADEMSALANALQLDPSQSAIAKTIGLLHDIGRFPQFARFKTYNDTTSVNHSQLGAKLLREDDILSGLTDNERRIITTAVEFHGAKEIPADLDGEELLMSKMIRDADKLDIYKVVIDFYEKFQAGKNEYEIETDLPNTPGKYSQKVLHLVCKGKLVDYALMTSWEDIKIVNVGWVHDINYDFALAQIKKRGYIEQILNYLPDNEEIGQLRKHITQYIENRINAAQTAGN